MLARLVSLDEGSFAAGVALADLKGEMNLGSSNTEHDAALTRILAEFQALAEEQAGRKLIRRECREEWEIRDFLPDTFLPAGLAPDIASIAEISWRGIPEPASAALDAADYRLLGERIQRVTDEWAWEAAGRTSCDWPVFVTARYTAGLADDIASAGSNSAGAMIRSAVYAASRMRFLSADPAMAVDKLYDMVLPAQVRDRRGQTVVF